jgi:methyl-accepting chemotaxis protein WspA
MVEQRHSFLTKLVGPLTYTQKFCLISCLFGFSILITSYFMINAQNSSINFVRKELKGLEVEIPLKKLSHGLIQQYLLMHRYLAGESQLKNEIVAMQAKISTEFEALLRENLEWQKSFEPVPRKLSPEAISSQWEFIVNNSKGMRIDEVETQYFSIMEDVQALINYLGDKSNLSFDSNYQSSYLIEAALLKDMEATLQTVKITSLAYSMIQNKKFLSTDKYELIALTNILQWLIDEIKLGGQKIIDDSQAPNSNPKLANAIREPLNIYVNHLQNFINYIENQILYAKDLPPDTQILLELAQKSFETTYTFSMTSIEELQKILESRLGYLQIQQNLSVVITLVCACAGCMLGFWIMRQISYPLTQLVQTARRLSLGDLSARVPQTSKDEVGEVGVAFNQMADSFQELIGQLQWTGIQLTTSTTEITATAKQQEATVVQQEATTKQIAATARDISDSAKEFAKTMNQVSSMAEKTSSLATSGKAGLTMMETIMRQMVEAAGNIASKLAILNEKAGSITTIITTISKVADQTNLLSLNAAIEAEKAGEYGRSFAVIAREIRRLADQTANALMDIEKMVNEMVSAVSAGVMGVDKFSEEIHTGVKQATTVGEQLTEIIEQVQQQTVGFETVNQGMQNQSRGAEEINDSITQLSEAAQLTTESIRQFHNAIEQLNNAAQEMQTAVSKIKR